ETKIRDINGEKIPIIVCQEKNNDNTNCDTSYVYTSRSTGNAIVHLRNAHEIIKQGKTKNNKQGVSNIKKHSEARQNQLRQSLTTWVIKDSQAIYVVSNELNTLDTQTLCSKSPVEVLEQ
ncbi:4687_t:CDS:2, partial [Racocetra persica]